MFFPHEFSIQHRWCILGSFVFKERRLNMWGTPGSVFRLEGFAQVTQPLVCLQKKIKAWKTECMTVFKREVISQSVLTWLKILVIVAGWGGGGVNIRNAVRILAVSQAGNFLYILQHGCKFSSWLMVNNYFDHLRLATKFACCKIRATKRVQRTIALYQYKLFNLFPFSVIEFCEVVMFKPWTQYVWSK